MKRLRRFTASLLFAMSLAPLAMAAPPNKHAAAPAKVAAPETAAGPKKPEAAPEAKKPEAAAVTTEVPADVMQSMDTTPPSRIAITAFQINGENITPALRYQLQDGFVLGLVRNGVNVIDLEELGKRLTDEPELLGCDSSPCLKRLGELVSSRHVVRVEINADGNSYRMIARIFRTTGAAPAALPIETQSRFCDVCTVTEAREAMIRLADGVRVPDEPDLVADPAKKIVQIRQENRLSRRAALFTMGGGVAAIIGGTLLLATSDIDAKGTNAIAGGLMGLGVGTAIFGLY